MGAGFQLIQSIKDGAQTPPPGISTLRLDGGPKWIESFAPGRAVMHWDVDSAYFNLEGAVICSWLACLADQAVFYATNTLLAEGENTRVASLRMDFIENVVSGRLTIEAVVVGRGADSLVTECRMLLDNGQTAVVATATSRIVKS
jgi:acyl-coenzyme A thioesterase PaaI-like protein